MPEIGEGKSGHLTRRGFVQVIGAAATTLAVGRCSPEGKALGLLVRATDGRGERQTAVEQGAYPDGASGYHALSFKVG